MKRASPAILFLLSALVACAPGFGQEPRQVPFTACTEGPAGGSSCDGPKGLHWTLGCFPRHGCPDDYSPNPYPRQCWPPYPPFYRCVPAGDGALPGRCGSGKDKLTWWFILTPQALREALWCQP